MAECQRGSSNVLPQSAIDQMTVVTGGLPAQYGDATGGIISITTQGPSRITRGGFEIIQEHAEKLVTDEDLLHCASKYQVNPPTL